MILPSKSIAMCVATLKALSISWVTMIEVAPIFSLSSMMSSSITELITGIESRAGLVVEDELRIHDDAAREADALAHAAAEFRRASCRGCPPCRPSPVFHPRVRRSRRATCGQFLERQREIVAHAQRTDERAVLIDHADLLPHAVQPPAAHARDVEALELHRAARRLEDAEDEAQQRALAAAGLARGRRGARVARHAQIHAGENFFSAEGETARRAARRLGLRSVLICRRAPRARCCRAYRSR